MHSRRPRRPDNYATAYLAPLTIRRVTNTATPAAIVNAHDYYPFGLEATDPCQDAEKHKWTGQERDQQGTCSTQTDDLDYMHARYENFNIGRFLSVDPVRGNPKRPQGFNLLAYVGNNPINRVDPLGLLELTVTPKASGGQVKTAADCEKEKGKDDPSCQELSRKEREKEDKERVKKVMAELVRTGSVSGEEELLALAHAFAQRGIGTCVGCARVLQGNAEHVGGEGAFPGVPISSGSAVVIPSQWGGRSQLRSFMQGVAGIAGGAYFDGIADVVGGDSPIPGWNVRAALQFLFPGRLILELPGGSDQGDMADVLLVGVPTGHCPSGTVECQ